MARASTPSGAVAVAMLILLVTGCRATAGRDEGRITSEIEAICHEQQAAWNRGDIEGFMRAGYWPSESLTFFSGGDVTRGYETVLARYRKRYTSEGAEMGRLEFSALETQLLGPDHALLRGRWQLDFEKREDVGGLFTLILRRTSDGWRIVHDHTSVAG